MGVELEKQPEKVSLIGAVRNFFKYYGTFSGRSSQSEYWLVWLAGFILLVLQSPLQLGASNVRGLLVGLAIVQTLALLAFAVPTLALMSRRLRDAGISPYFLFLLFLPVLGGLALWVMMMFPSKEQATDLGQSHP